MPRPRRAQPAPSWSSSSRMARPHANPHANPHATPKPNSNLQIVLYDRPRYVAGAAPPQKISLVLPRDADAYIVDKVITPFDGWGAQAATADEYDTDEEDARYAQNPQRRTVQRVLNYVVGWPDKPYACELVPCTRILDYVSPYTLETYEYELCERQRRRREQQTSQQNSQQKKTQKKQPRAQPHFVTATARAAARPQQKRDRGRFTSGAHSAAADATAADRPTKPAKPAKPTTQASQTSQAAPSIAGSVQITLSPSKHASLSQPVVSLSPSRPRMPPTQTTLSLKRPFDTFSEQPHGAATAATATPTETETESADDGWLQGGGGGEEEEEDDDDDDDEEEDEEDDDDELHGALPRVTPIPPPFVPVLPRSTAASRGPPALQTVRSGVEPSKYKRAKTEATPVPPRVTPIPPPVYPRVSAKPPLPPPDKSPDDDDDDEELYEVDRLEGDCYTYIDDDADGTVVPDGAPVPKKLVRYFSVRWKGDWPPDQNPTWEPAENLPPQMVQQYLRQVARQEQEQAQAQRGNSQDHQHDIASDEGRGTVVSSDIV